MVTGGRGSYGVPGQKQLCTFLGGLGPSGEEGKAGTQSLCSLVPVGGNGPKAARTGVQHT